MANIDEARSLILTIVEEQTPRDRFDQSLQSGTVLSELSRRIKISQSLSEEQILTVWYDFFRSGYLAWGVNLSNPDPPFFHITDRGKKALVARSRDPSNPGGYLNHLEKEGTNNNSVLSYVREGLTCYNLGAHRAAAVMLGAAMETLILELRDSCIKAMSAAGEPVPKKLKDWKLKTILDSILKMVESNEEKIDAKILSEFHVHWSAITHQIRTTRNDSGHPTNIAVIDAESVHASYLLLPKLAALAGQMKGELCALYN